MRAVLAAIMVALSGVTGSARAASVLFLDSQPGDFILPDMAHLRGQGRLRARTRVGRVTVTIAVSERFQGTKTENGFQLGAGALSRAALVAALASPTP